MKRKRNEKRNKKKEKRKNYTRETKKEKEKKTSIPIAFVISEFTQSHDGPCAAMFFYFNFFFLFYLYFSFYFSYFLFFFKTPHKYFTQTTITR